MHALTVRPAFEIAKCTGHQHIFDSILMQRYLACAVPVVQMAKRYWGTDGMGEPLRDSAAAKTTVCEWRRLFEDVGPVWAEERGIAASQPSTPQHDVSIAIAAKMDQARMRGEGPALNSMLGTAKKPATANAWLKAALKAFPSTVCRAAKRAKLQAAATTVELATHAEAAPTVEQN